jgi:hypothetical protein
VYSTDAAGNKQFMPDKVIEAAPFGSGIDANTTAIDAATSGN